MRAHPDLSQLKRQAKELLAAFKGGEQAAASEVHAHYRHADVATFALHDAQLVLARAYGFESWARLRAFVDGVTIRELAEAIKAGDVERAAGMLRKRPELAEMDMAEDDERQALHVAVLYRQPEIVRLLMQHGADARKGIYPHRDATTALTLATERDFPEIVAILRDEERRSARTLQRDNSRPPIPESFEEILRRRDQDEMIRQLEAQPLLRTIHFQHPLMTPLHSAAAMLFDKMAIWLIEHGADVNARIDDGPSPLEIVGCSCPPPFWTEQEVAGLARILLDRGAQMTPRAAVALGDAGWLRARHAEGTLANGLPRNQGYRGLLEIAATHRQPGILKLLLDFGFDPDEVLPKGDSGDSMRGGPLEVCLRTQQFDLAQLLIARGATVDARAAVQLSDTEWLRARHAAGALENEIGQDGGLVALAVRKHRPEVVRLLLEFGFDPDERVRVDGIEEAVYSGGHALHCCAGNGELEMAEMLLQHGADPNLHVYAAGPPVFVAYSRKDMAMVDLLEKYGAVVDASTAGILRLTDKARQLLEDEAAGRLSRHAHAPGWSLAEELLFYGADGGDPMIVRMALERIAWQPDNPKWHGMLMRNLGNHPEPDRRRHVECFRLMLARCNPGVPGKFGRTILHDLAADWPHPSPSAAERVELAELALTAGARLDIRDELLKSTPLGWACRWGRTELVKLYLERGADPAEPDAEPWAAPRAWCRKMHWTELLQMIEAVRGA
jgi:ankyrin repeat protein